LKENNKRPVSNEKQPSFSDALKTSWIKSSIIWGIIFLTIGLIIIFTLKLLNIGNTPLISNTKAFIENYGLIGIFLATILAGTIIPLGSPALVVAAALFGIDPIQLILIATIGFTIGMSVNYGLAYRLGRPYVTKKMTPKKLEEVTYLWGRWGWILYTIFGLIPFLPVELLAFICGLLKTRLDIFLVLSFTPRLIVFTILAYFGETAGNWMGLA
jgi:membrane protein YqaA with SNARE-associated domain